MKEVAHVQPHEPWQNETKQIHRSSSVSFGKRIPALFYTDTIPCNFKKTYVCLVAVIESMFLFSFAFSSFARRLCEEMRLSTTVLSKKI